jgi:molybdopterin/thiamine biosynthesis adenylyltransferase
MSLNGEGINKEELFSDETKEILKEVKVLIVGLGGLGSFVATELAHLGVKNLLLVDNDRVSYSNLNRQILYGYADVGKSKSLVASRKLRSVYPDLRVEAFDTRLTPANGKYLVEKSDIVIDCTDNFETKKLLNRLCFALKRGFISAGVGSWEGWVASFPFFEEDENIPCLECLFPKDLEALKEFGGENLPTSVTTVATMATLQVQEFIKMITGEGENLKGKTLLVDLKNYQCVPVKLNKNPNCPVCGKKV